MHHLSFITQQNNIHNLHSRYKYSADGNLSRRSASKMFIPELDPAEGEDPVHTLAHWAENKHPLRTYSYYRSAKADGT